MEQQPIELNHVPPRKLKNLLLFLVMNLEKYIPEEAGICNTIGQMKTDGLITPDEEYMLFQCILAYKPEYDNKLTGHFWWPAYEIEPRINYLNELIRKLYGA